MFDFNVSVVDLDGDRKLVSVKMLESKNQGLAYFTRMKKAKKELFDNLKIKDYTQFIITPENYAVLFGDKNVEQYMKYFNQIYISE